MSQQAGPIYSAEQIRIPPELPEILKNYAKFVIKNQPQDIVGASATYFSKLMNQTKQAGKDGKLSNAQLNTFMKKFQVGKPSVTKKEIQEACEWADISENQRDDTLSMGGWTADQVPWMHFFGFLVASVGGNFYITITLLITLASDSGLTQASIFRSVFNFLAEQDKSIKPEFIVAVNKYLSSAGNALPTDKFAVTISEMWENPEPVEEDVTMEPPSSNAEPTPDTQKDTEMAD